MVARRARVWDETLGEYADIAGLPGADGADGTSVGGVPVHIGTTLPTDPQFVWFDTTGGNLQIKYEDGV